MEWFGIIGTLLLFLPFGATVLEPDLENETKKNKNKLKQIKINTKTKNGFQLRIIHDSISKNTKTSYKIKLCLKKGKNEKSESFSITRRPGFLSQWTIL